MSADMMQDAFEAWLADELSIAGDCSCFNRGRAAGVDGHAYDDDVVECYWTGWQAAAAQAAEIADLRAQLAARIEPAEPVARVEREDGEDFVCWYSDVPAGTLLYADPQSITQPAPSIPEGMVLMPTEINAILPLGFAYLDAAREAEPNIRWSFSHAGYRAMLAAAAPKQNDGGDHD